MFEEPTALIEKRLADNWVTTKIASDGMEFNPVRGVSYVRLQTEWADTNQISIGGMERGIGYIMVSVFTPHGKGSRPALVLADELRLLYNKWISGKLSFGVARIIRVGEKDEWYQVNVLVPFKYDECNP